MNHEQSRDVGRLGKLGSAWSGYLSESVSARGGDELSESIARLGLRALRLLAQIPRGILALTGQVAESDPEVLTFLELRWRPQDKVITRAAAAAKISKVSSQKRRIVHTDVLSPEFIHHVPLPQRAVLALAAASIFFQPLNYRVLRT